MILITLFATAVFASYHYYNQTNAAWISLGGDCRTFELDGFSGDLILSGDNVNLEGACVLRFLEPVSVLIGNSFQVVDDLSVSFSGNSPNRLPRKLELKNVALQEVTCGNAVTFFTFADGPVTAHIPAGEAQLCIDGGCVYDGKAQIPMEVLSAGQGSNFRESYEDEGMAYILTVRRAAQDGSTISVAFQPDSTAVTLDAVGSSGYRLDGSTRSSSYETGADSRLQLTHLQNKSSYNTENIFVDFTAREYDTSLLSGWARGQHKYRKNHVLTQISKTENEIQIATYGPVKNVALAGVPVVSNFFTWLFVHAGPAILWLIALLLTTYVNHLFLQRKGRDAPASTKIKTVV